MSGLNYLLLLANKQAFIIYIVRHLNIKNTRKLHHKTTAQEGTTKRRTAMTTQTTVSVVFAFASGWYGSYLMQAPLPCEQFKPFGYASSVESSPSGTNLRPVQQQPVPWRQRKAKGETWDMVVLGAGPAGLTAALSVLCLQIPSTLSQNSSLVFSNMVHNYAAKWATDSVSTTNTLNSTHRYTGMRRGQDYL